jgi:hypothetical protein
VVTVVEALAMLVAVVVVVAIAVVVAHQLQITGLAVVVVVHIPLQPTRTTWLEMLTEMVQYPSLILMRQRQQHFRRLNQLQHNLRVHSRIQ